MSSGGANLVDCLKMRVQRARIAVERKDDELEYVKQLYFAERQKREDAEAEIDALKYVISLVEEDLKKAQEKIKHLSGKS
ncbi:hypothetical protein FO519_001794 [Halicephalobus sp. NKZ332]|nr:hypothetical protein FO519_001794 [Halicephalobus sp. NKZ332]